MRVGVAVATTGITITPDFILITEGAKGWAISREDGSIMPETNYIPIVDCDDNLTVSCYNYACYHRKIPQKLRPRWVEVMIKWHNVKLNMYGNWETWLAWLDYIDPAEFRDGMMVYGSLGEYLFPAAKFPYENIDDIQCKIADAMIEKHIAPDPAIIEGVREWLALAGREQISFLFRRGYTDFYLYFREKFRHHDDFTKVRNIWHDFCKVMERRANENAVSCDKG